MTAPLPPPASSPTRGEGESRPADGAAGTPQRRHTVPLSPCGRGARGEGFRHVVLVGLSGSGKSTVGPLLATRLARPFVDTDDLIVADAGLPIPQIFAERGEAIFREIERRAVRRALAGPPAVLATGGGAPVGARNRAALWDGNFVVWLDAPVETLAARLDRTGAGRPLLATGGPAARLAALRAERERVYASAHARIDTTVLSPCETVQVILEALAPRLSPSPRGRTRREPRVPAPAGVAGAVPGGLPGEGAGG